MSARQIVQIHAARNEIARRLADLADQASELGDGVAAVALIRAGLTVEGITVAPARSITPTSLSSWHRSGLLPHAKV